jgi:TP901-1 family phage major tail protein
MAVSGRKLRISRAGTAIVGARTDSVTINNEPIDITDKDDAGWRTMLADVGVRSLSCEVEGVLKNATLLGIGVGTSSALLEACTAEVEGIATFSGNFYLQSIALGAEQADTVTFTATLESAGTVTATIAPYNTVLPAITGTATVGQTLTTTNGTWAGDATITFARQWQRGNVADHGDPSWTNIASATNLTYVLQVADSAKRIRCIVTATNSEGSTVALSNIVGPIA